MFRGFGENTVKVDKKGFLGSGSRTQLIVSKLFLSERQERKRKLNSKIHCYLISGFGESIVNLDKILTVL